MRTQQQVSALPQPVKYELTTSKNRKAHINVVTVVPLGDE